MGSTGWSFSESGTTGIWPASGCQCGFRWSVFPQLQAILFPAAIVYGPVVLACRSPEGNPVSIINFANLESSLVPSPGEPLSFHLASDPNVLFRPYYQFKEGERYFIYFDPKHPWTRLRLHELKFSPGWSLNLTEDM